MKTNKILLAVLMVAMPLFGFAQEWDDIYADSDRSERVTEEVTRKEPQKKKVVIVKGDAAGMEVKANGRDVDEYNRRGNNGYSAGDITHQDDTLGYEDYQYTDRIVRFHDPESSIKISGADEVIVYVGDDLYSNYNNRGWNSNFYYGWSWGMGYYPWYDVYYNPWYSPWYYGGWYDPWYYGWGGYYGWSRWYRPWYYGSWYSPWYYSSWYSPWYYGGWYDPWYYGWGGYYGGYSHGFYDGYYNGRYNHSGRTSGAFRRSTANRTNTTARNSIAAGRSNRDVATRSAISGRNTTDTRRL